jgi:hypothetical protein
MSTCATCGAYYRLTSFHKDNINCEDCAYILPKSTIDEEEEYEIHQILHPGSKTEPVRYYDDDLG